MNNKRTLFVAIISVSLSLLFHGCPMFHDSNCTDKVIGRGSTNDSSLAWIPYNSIDTIKLSNNNGFQDMFISTGYFNDSIIVEHRIYDENHGDPNSPCYEVYTMPIKRITFTSLSINLKMSFEIQKNISYSQIIEEVEPDLISDIIVIKINDDIRTVSPNCLNPEIFNEIEILDSLSINGKTYHNVTHAFKHSNDPYITLDGIYYTKFDGLIGFYLTNSEKWYIE